MNRFDKWPSLCIAGILLSVSFTSKWNEKSIEEIRISKTTNDTLSLPELRQMRKEATNRTRRIIFNNDGNESFRLVNELSEKSILKPRTLGLENSQVDAIYYCTSHAWGLFNHHTTVGTELRVKENPATATLFKNNVTGELIDGGLDPLKVMVKFAHEHRKEIFWSMRMNDTHDGGKTGYGPVLFSANKIKTAHPEYLLGRPFEKGSGSWSAVNYSLPEVRNLTLRYIEEVCTNFDVDGIELDFFRHRVFFKSTFKGQNATDGERAAMTDLLKSIRAMTEQVGLKRKRPVLVSMRVPDSKEYAFDVGLNIEEWLKEDLVDVMSVSSYIRLNPWQTSVALGHKYGVKVYPSLDESRLDNKEASEERNSIESYRGQATEGWAAGADGIYLFNFFDPKSSLWKELGSYDQLLSLDRDYYATVRGLGKVAAVNHLPYFHLPVLSPDSPQVISTTPSSIPVLFYGKTPDKGFVYLKWRLNTEVVRDEMSISINNHIISTYALKNGWFTAKLNYRDVIDGENIIVMKMNNTSTNSIKLLDLKISYRTKAEE